MASLNNVRQKLDHAQVHFKRFETALCEYFATNPHAMIRDPDSSAEKPTFSVQVLKPIPSHIGFIAGDCLQNMRSALDYLVWELVLAANNQPGKAHMFPVCLSEKSFKEAIRGERLKGIDPAAIALIDSLQPYHAGDEDAVIGHPLAVLDSLVNINKHRRVLLTFVQSAPFAGMEFRQIGNALLAVPALSDLNLDAEFGKRLTPEEVQMHGGLMALITLQEGATQGTEITTCLFVFLDYLRDDLIPQFECFFA